MSEIKEQIVERLRARRTVSLSWPDAALIALAQEYDLELEAADRIEALERERTNLIETKREQLGRMSARIKALEEALRPFAEAPADWTIYTVNAARLALNATPQDGKGGEEW